MTDAIAAGNFIGQQADVCGPRHEIGGGLLIMRTDKSDFREIFDEKNKRKS